MGADKYPGNTPNAPKFMLFGISMKKKLHWASVVRVTKYFVAIVFGKNSLVMGF